MDAVTRKEKILDGQDLTPVTRKEYFLKKAVSEGGGGAFVISIDDETGAMDKTWNEIKTAIANGVPVLVPYEEATAAYLTYIYFVASTPGVKYDVFITTDTESESPYASCDNADGYPILLND